MSSEVAAVIGDEVLTHRLRIADCCEEAAR